MRSLQKHETKTRCSLQAFKSLESGAGLFLRPVSPALLVPLLLQVVPS